MKAKPEKKQINKQRLDPTNLQRSHSLVVTRLSSLEIFSQREEISCYDEQRAPLEYPLLVMSHHVLSVPGR